MRSAAKRINSVDTGIHNFHGFRIVRECDAIVSRTVSIGTGLMCYGTRAASRTPRPRPPIS